jgi:mannose-6-phosphate isomerase-like protein (cupin superfamily)
MRSVPEADYEVVERAQLPQSELQGYLHGAGVCLIFVDLPPGRGPRLHRHAYEEVFVMLEGRARFTIGDATLEARPGQVLIVRPGVAHKFVNVGEGTLRQVDIHASPRFITEWLEP